MNVTNLLRTSKISIALSSLLLSTSLSALTINSAVGQQDVTTDENITITSTGSISGAVDLNITVNPFTSTIINDGNITSTSSNAIVITGNNLGVITNNGIITTNGFSSTAIIIDGDNNQTITNNGTINTSNTAINLANNHSNLINTGDINASSGTGFIIANNYSDIINTGDINASSLAITINGNNTANIENNGTLSSSNGHNLLSTIKINTNSGTITNNGTIKNTGTFSGNSGALAVKINSASSGASFDGGTIINTGTIAGGIDAKGTKLVNSGTLDLSRLATLTASVYDYNQTKDGILKIGADYDTTTSTTKTSLLHATNNINIENNSSIFINVLAVGDENQTLLDGGSVNILTADGELNLGDDLNITDNSEVLEFNLQETEFAGQKQLKVTFSAGSYEDKTVEGGENPYKDTGRALDKIKKGNYTGMNSFMTALNQLDSAQKVAKAISDSTTQIGVATTNAITQVAGSIQNVVDTRQNFTLSGANSGDIAFSDKNLWFKPFGGFGKQKDKNGINGFDMNNVGFGFGADAKYDDESRIGAAIFYNDVSVDVNNAPQTSDMDVYTALVYGNKPISKINSDFLYQVGYSLQKTKTSRTIEILSETAKAEYLSKTLSVDLKLMRNYRINKDLTFQPTVQTTYRNIATPSYTESGSSANLNVDKKNKTQIVLSVGTMAKYKYNSNLILNGNVNIGYDFDHDDQTISSAYANASDVSFDTKGIDNGAYIYNLGFGTTLLNVADGSLDFDYNYQGQGDKFSTHQFSAKYIYKF